MEEKTIILKCKVPKCKIKFRDLRRSVFVTKHSKEFWAGWGCGWTCDKHKNIKN